MFRKNTKITEINDVRRPLVFDESDPVIPANYTPLTGDEADVLLQQDFRLEDDGDYMSLDKIKKELDRINSKGVRIL